MINSIQGMGRMSGAAGMMPKGRELTEEQKALINEIISQYDPANVSDEDAKVIFQAFHDARITPARGMKEVIEAAGFDAEDLRARGLTDQGMMPPPPPQGSRSNTINLSALQSLQEILNQYDLTNLTESDQTSLLSQLEENGLVFLGSVLDIKS